MCVCTFTHISYSHMHTHALTYMHTHAHSNAHTHTGTRETGPTTKRPEQVSPYGTILDKAIRAAATSLIAAAKSLDELDSKVCYVLLKSTTKTTKLFDEKFTCTLALTQHTHKTHRSVTETAERPVATHPKQF